MIRKRRARVPMAMPWLLAGALVLVGSLVALRAQTGSVSDLRERLRADNRYDIVVLQNGVGLVPGRAGSDVRLIEIREGAAFINGTAVTAAELREQVGEDADLILPLTYLDRAAQLELAGVTAPAPLPVPAAQPEPSAQPAPAESAARRPRVRRGDLVRIGGSIALDRDEMVTGDLVAIGGSADIDGEVEGDAVVVGGSMRLGPDALVRGDAVVVGGALDRDPNARVVGSLHEIGLGSVTFPRLDLSRPFGSTVSRTSRLMATLLRVTLLMLAALVIVAAGRHFVESVADRTAVDPVRAGLVGLLAEVAFIPLLVITIVALVVSVVGIPLLLLVPFGMVLVFVLMLIGFTGAAWQVGRWLGPRLGLAGGTYASVAVGILALTSLSIVARLVALAGGGIFGPVLGGPVSVVGYLVEYVAWTVGTGAIMLTWFDGRRRQSAPAPPVPPVPPAPPVPTVADGEAGVA